MWSKDRKIDSMVKKIELLSSIFFCKDRRDRRAKINGSNSIFWQKKWENCQTHTKNTFIRANNSFFESNLIFLIFFKDRRERFDLFQRSMRVIRSFRSFSKIGGSDLITVNLFKRSMRTVCSRSIFLKDRREGFDHGRFF